MYWYLWFICHLCINVWKYLLLHEYRLPDRNVVDFFMGFHGSVNIHGNPWWATRSFFGGNPIRGSRRWRWWKGLKTCFFKRYWYDIKGIHWPQTNEVVYRFEERSRLQNGSNWKVDSLKFDSLHKNEYISHQWKRKFIFSPLDGTCSQWIMKVGLNRIPFTKITSLKFNIGTGNGHVWEGNRWNSFSGPRFLVSMFNF